MTLTEIQQQTHWCREWTNSFTGTTEGLPEVKFQLLFSQLTGPVWFPSWGNYKDDTVTSSPDFIIVELLLFISSSQNWTRTTRSVLIKTAPSFHPALPPQNSFINILADTFDKESPDTEQIKEHCPVSCSSFYTVRSWDEQMATSCWPSTFQSMPGVSSPRPSFHPDKTSSHTQLWVCNKHTCISPMNHLTTPRCDTCDWTAEWEL